jgi:hypothetical protein
VAVESLIYACTRNTTLARTSTPPAFEPFSTKNVLPRPDKTRVKIIATKLIEFDVNAGDHPSFRLSLLDLRPMMLALSSAKKTIANRRWPLIFLLDLSFMA